MNIIFQYMNENTFVFGYLVVITDISLVIVNNYIFMVRLIKQKCSYFYFKYHNLRFSEQ